VIDFYLRVFLAAAKNGSFTKAAQLLNITQPAVTHQIKNLEEMFKARLFVRRQSRIYLTKSGKILYQYASEIGRLYRQAQQEMAELSGRTYGDVSFGATSLLGSYLLPLYVGEFKQRHPDIHLSMQVGNSRDIIRSLRDGIVEFAIVSEPFPLKGFTIIPFCQDDLILIVPPDHPWCREKAIDAERIFKEPFIIREPGSGTREVYMKTLKRLYPRNHLQVAMVLGSTEAIKRGIMGKMGVSIVSRLACRFEIEQGILRGIEMKGVRMKRAFNILFRSEEDLSVQAAKWKEFLLGKRGKSCLSV